LQRTDRKNYGLAGHWCKHWNRGK